jgi:hypothetical protein
MKISHKIELALQVSEYTHLRQKKFNFTRLLKKNMVQYFYGKSDGGTIRAIP